MLTEGQHLILDLYDCDYDKIKDWEIMEILLNNLPKFIGMTVLKTAETLTHLDPSNPDWGVTGTVILCESHASIHTFPERNFAYCDLFSCASFDAIKARDFIVEATGSRHYVEMVLKRGGGAFNGNNY